MQAPLILKTPHLACKIWTKKYLLCIEKSSSSHVALSESCINTNNRHSTCRCQNHPFKLKAWVTPCSPTITRAALLSASCHSDLKDPQHSPYPSRPAGCGARALRGCLRHCSCLQRRCAYLCYKALTTATTLESNFVDQYLFGLRLSKNRYCRTSVRLVLLFIFSFTL